MKKNFLFLWSLMIVVLISACSEHDKPSSIEGPKADVMIKLNFEGASMAGKTKAGAQSTAIPETSWDNIKQVQFLLYNTTTNKISFSAIEKPSTSKKSFTYSVPVGNYKLVAVANANSSTNDIVTSLDDGASNVQWDMWNVRQKDAMKLIMTHKPSEFPDFCKSQQNAAGNKAYKVPSEIFMGSADVTVSAGSAVTSNISLTREVSLMRVRLNVKEGEHGVDNNTSVKYNTNDASIMIFRLPKNMSIMADNQGGVNTASEIKHVLSVSGAGTFKTADPTSGYNPKLILKDNFTMWNDVIVFPNNNGRADNSDVTGTATADRQYFIVISASGKSGHVLADGTTLTGDKTVYWSGIIKEKFVPNTIREVNLTLRTGGTTVVPTQPTQNGDLTITVSEPAKWNTNIVESSIIL